MRENLSQLGGSYQSILLGSIIESSPSLLPAYEQTNVQRCYYNTNA